MLTYQMLNGNVFADVKVTRARRCTRQFTLNSITVLFFLFNCLELIWQFVVVVVLWRTLQIESLLILDLQTHRHTFIY